MSHSDDLSVYWLKSLMDKLKIILINKKALSVLAVQLIFTLLRNDFSLVDSV